MGDDLISRQAAIEAMRELPHEYNTKEQRARTGGIAACQTIIRELPSVHPKTGRWILDTTQCLPEYVCTDCKSRFPLVASGGFYGTLCCENMNYCPNCGAKMEDNENE